MAALLLAASTSSPSVAWSGSVAITLHITSRSDSAQAVSAESALGASAVASSDCVMSIASWRPIPLTSYQQCRRWLAVGEPFPGASSATLGRPVVIVQRP